MFTSLLIGIACNSVTTIILCLIIIRNQKETSK
jgi:hypothetical protein